MVSLFNGINCERSREIVTGRPKIDRAADAPNISKTVGLTISRSASSQNEQAAISCGLGLWWIRR